MKTVILAATIAAFPVQTSTVEPAVSLEEWTTSGPFVCPAPEKGFTCERATPNAYPNVHLEYVAGYLWND